MVYLGDLRISITPNSRIYWLIDRLKNKKFESRVVNNMVEIKIRDTTFYLPYSRDWLDTEVNVTTGDKVLPLNLPTGCMVNFCAYDIGADVISVTKLGKSTLFYSNDVPYISDTVDEI